MFDFVIVLLLLQHVAERRSSAGSSRLSVALMLARPDAFEGHLQFCRRAVATSLFKPTWELQ